MKETFASWVRQGDLFRQLWVKEGLSIVCAGLPTFGVVMVNDCRNTGVSCLAPVLGDWSEIVCERETWNLNMNVMIPSMMCKTKRNLCQILAGLEQRLR